MNVLANVQIAEPYNTAKIVSINRKILILKIGKLGGCTMRLAIILKTNIVANVAWMVVLGKTYHRYQLKKKSQAFPYANVVKKYPVF